MGIISPYFLVRLPAVLDEVPAVLDEVLDEVLERPVASWPLLLLLHLRLRL
jgi:hypothetical protein